MDDPEHHQFLVETNPLNPQVLAPAERALRANYAWMCRLIPVGCLQVKISLNTYWYERSGMRIKDNQRTLDQQRPCQNHQRIPVCIPTSLLDAEWLRSLQIFSWMNVWFPWVGRLPHRNGQLISSPAKRSADGFARSSAPRSKCETNLAKIYKYTSWSWTAEQLLPLSDWPQATSDPDRCKCTFCGLNLLHAFERILNRGAVTTMVWIAPSNHWPIS